MQNSLKNHLHTNFIDFNLKIILKNQNNNRQNIKKHQKII